MMIMLFILLVIVAVGRFMGDEGASVSARGVYVPGQAGDVDVGDPMGKVISRREFLGLP